MRPALLGLLPALVVAGCLGGSSLSAPLPVEGQCITALSATEDGTTITGYSTIECGPGKAGYQVVKVFSGAGSCPKPGTAMYIDEKSGPITKLWWVCLREQ